MSSLQCGDCLPGQFATTCKCFDCPPGTFSNISRATACENCPVSQYSLPGSTFCNNCTMWEKIFYVKPPFARWHAANFDAAYLVLKDSTGNRRHSVSATGLGAATTATGNGATVPQTVLQGGTGASIRLPAGSLPAVFTLCTMTRYTGAAKGRIINAFGANFAHGHSDTYRGVAYYGDAGKWATSAQDLNSGNSLDWLVMCSKSFGKAPRNVLANGQAVGTRDTPSVGDLQLAINTGQSGSASDFAFAHAIVFDQALSDEEMGIISSIMVRSLTDASINIASLGACTCTGSVVCTKLPWARYHASSWDPVSNAWLDTSGFNRHTVSTQGTIQVKTASGDGATALQSFLYGNTAAKLLFPAGSIPGHYTVCALSRYNGASRNRIFGSYSSNWKLGHWNGQRGRVYHESVGWVAEGISGTVTDWLVTCWKNPGMLPNNVLLNGVASGKLNTNFWANWQMSLNNPNPYGGEVSDWAASHVMIWSEALTDAEMAQVSTAFVNSLSDASVQVSALGSFSTCNCSMAWTACGGGSSTGTQVACLACIKCKSGTYLAPLCNGGCFACPYGTFSNSTTPGGSSCTKCSVGLFSPVAGAKECFGCPEGRYAPSTGMTMCLGVSILRAPS
jgi:hypothetical protein